VNPLRTTSNHLSFSLYMKLIFQHSSKPMDKSDLTDRE
jgi:hypothetical protein